MEQQRMTDGSGAEDGREIGEIRVEQNTGKATLLLKKEVDQGKRWSLRLEVLQN